MMEWKPQEWLLMLPFILEMLWSYKEETGESQSELLL
jgi:hypothetical protein